MKPVLPDGASARADTPSSPAQTGTPVKAQANAQPRAQAQTQTQPQAQTQAQTQAQGNAQPLRDDLRRIIIRLSRDLGKPEPGGVNRFH